LRLPPNTAVERGIQAGTMHAGRRGAMITAWTPSLPLLSPASGRAMSNA
jgi:hypothetical protein